MKKYKEHRRLFFDEETQSWLKDFADSDCSSEFSSVEDFEIGFGLATGNTPCPESNTSRSNDIDSDECFEDPLSTVGHEPRDENSPPQGNCGSTRQLAT